MADRESDLKRMNRLSHGPNRVTERRAVKMLCQYMRENWWRGEAVDGDSDVLIEIDDFRVVQPSGRGEWHLQCYVEGIPLSFGPLGVISMVKINRAHKKWTSKQWQIIGARDAFRFKTGREITNQELCEAFGLPRGSFD